MADFMTSTHKTKWIYTPQDIKHKYKVANQRAKQALEMFGTTRMEVDIDGTFSYAESQNDAKDNAEKRPKPLKVEEEQLLRAFYEFKIQDVCDAFKFPRKIQATALIYFKRFYLLWSVMEHHPKDIMLTCIYAACKAEENHVSAEELGKGIGQDHHSLGFDLIAYAPYRALEGFISDLEEFCGAQDDDQLVALKVIVISFRQEKVVQMKSPSTLSLRIQVTKGSKWRKRATIDSWEGLALAALHRANAAHGIFDFERYLRSVLSHHDQPGHAISELTGSINAIDSLAILLLPELLAFEQIGKLLTPTSKDVKHIDRKLKSCLDPGSHDKCVQSTLI
uniref:CAK associated cyclinH homolog n=1 Tax=Solanum tuberosum TaxID=4113 RepID=M1CAQ9_SOLTU